MNFKTEFIQICFCCSADFIQPSFHLFCDVVVSWLLSINRARLFLFFDLHCGVIYACTIYIANLHACTIYIAVVHACTIYIVDLHACTIYIVDLHACTIYINCGFTCLYDFTLYYIAEYLTVWFTFMSWRLNCWSPSLSPVLFPVIAEPSILE